MISAHRCGAGSDLDLENTKAALDRALTLDVDYVEFDVQRLGDGTFVLFHDDFVKLDGRTVPMSELTFEQFSGMADHFMRYDDVLAALKGVKHAHIDLKFVSPESAYAVPETTYEVAATQQALEILGPGQFIITTLEDQSVRAVRDWSDGVGLDLLVGLSLGRDTSEMSVVEALRTRLSEFFPAARIRDSREPRRLPAEDRPVHGGALCPTSGPSAPGVDRRRARRARVLAGAGRRVAGDDELSGAGDRAGQGRLVGLCAAGWRVTRLRRAREQGGSGHGRVEICWTPQAFPSGSEKKQNPTLSSGCGIGVGFSPRTWTSVTSTPRSASSARAFVTSLTTSCRPLIDPGGIGGTTPSPMTTEHPDPGGVSCTIRWPSPIFLSWSTWKPSLSL